MCASLVNRNSLSAALHGSRPGWHQRAVWRVARMAGLHLAGEAAAACCETAEDLRDRGRSPPLSSGVCFTPFLSFKSMASRMVISVPRARCRGRVQEGRGPADKLLDRARSRVERVHLALQGLELCESQLGCTAFGTCRRHDIAVGVEGGRRERPPALARERRQQDVGRGVQIILPMTADGWRPW